MPALGNETIEFDITNGKVVPSESFAAKVTVLGTAISAGSTHVPVTVQAQIGDTVLEPWGSYGSTAGDVNDSSGIRHYIYNEQLDAGEEIVVSGQSWLYGCSYLAVDSNEETRQVKVLRNGDLAPSISGFNGQSDADDYIREYLEGGTVNIHENQVIYLFELGTTNLNSGAADFQDLVVLVTLGESVEALQPTQTNPLYD
ncbi:MAG: hypothetical protein AAGF84_09935 [Planctomycetota bacterium]